MNSEFLAGVLKVWQSFRFFWCLFCGTICVFVFFWGGMTVWLQNILLTHSPWPKLGPRCCRRPKHSWKSTVQMRNFRFKTLSFPSNGSRDRDTMMMKVPMAGQTQHDLAIGSRLTCLIVASADFQKHEDLVRNMHLISKLLVNTAGQPLDFPNDFRRFHNMLCTKHPLPTLLHK